VAVGAHCRLEALAGFHLFSCEEHAGAGTSPAHSEKDCGDDGCWAIESGSYQLQKPLEAPARPFLTPVAWLPILSDLSPAGSTGRLISASPAPPELPKLWQFSERTALPPRAPTFVA